MSSTRGGTDVEVPVIVSGMPSPSVSAWADGSVGKASGPASQTPATASAPSQYPSPSVSGLVGSWPIASSSRSEIPSLSSSSSASLPMPSPSKSSHSVGSVGKASGPASQTPANAIGPSQYPSPSVSGLVESVPVALSSRSVRPSLSSSSSATRPGVGPSAGS